MTMKLKPTSFKTVDRTLDDVFDSYYYSLSKCGDNKEMQIVGAVEKLIRKQVNHARRISNTK